MKFNGKNLGNSHQNVSISHQIWTIFKKFFQFYFSIWIIIWLTKFGYFLSKFDNFGKNNPMVKCWKKCMGNDAFSHHEKWIKILFKYEIFSLLSICNRLMPLLVWFLHYSWFWLIAFTIYIYYLRLLFLLFYISDIVWF